MILTISLCQSFTSLNSCVYSTLLFGLSRHLCKYEMPDSTMETLSIKLAVTLLAGNFGVSMGKDCLCNDIFYLCKVSIKLHCYNREISNKMSI